MAQVVNDDYTRIPVVLRRGIEYDTAFALKRGMEEKYGKPLSWAALVRKAFTALAKAEKIKCQ